MTFRRYAPIGRVGGGGFDPTLDQTITGNWDFEARVRFYDAGGTDYAELLHDGTDFNIDFVNTAEFNINDVGVLITGGASGLSTGDGIWLHHDNGITPSRSYLDARDPGGTFGYGDLQMRCEDLGWFVVGNANVSSLGTWLGGGSTAELTGSTVTLDASVSVELENDTNVTGDLDVTGNITAGNLPEIIVLGSDFSTTSTTAADVGLDFTVLADTIVLIEFIGMVETNTVAASAPRIGFSFPTGENAQTGQVQLGISVSASTEPQQRAFFGGLDGSMLATASTNLNVGLPVWGYALIDMGGTPGGNFSVTLATETSPNSVKLNAGSMLRVTTLG